MNTTLTLSLLTLGWFTLAGPVAAQDPETKVPEVAEGSGSTPGRRTAKKTPPAPIPVNVPIAGVSTDAVPKVLADVRGMSRALFACFECQRVENEEGNCTRCEAPLQPKGTTEIVSRADMSVDRRYLAITLEPGQWGSVQRFDQLLATSSARVKRDKLRIPTFARILVTGIQLDSAPRFRSALIEAKLFPAVGLASDPATGGLWLTPEVTSPRPTLGQVLELLRSLDAKAEVADVQWTTPCYTCSKKSALKPGCSTCWPAKPEAAKDA